MSICCLKVQLSRDFIKLSPVFSAIIPHKTLDGHISKLGYVKLSAFSQVNVALTHGQEMQFSLIFAIIHCITIIKSGYCCSFLTDSCS